MTRRVVLIVGPPAAGKSTLARQLAADEGLTHLEREQFADDPEFLAAAHHATTPAAARVVVVRCCPKITEQADLERSLGATETIVLDPDPQLCIRRAALRRRTGWRREIHAITVWRSTRAQTATETAPTAQTASPGAQTNSYPLSR